MEPAVATGSWRAGRRLGGVLSVVLFVAAVS
jgi:hypothetical protein